jgi:MFS family permease
MVYALPNCVIPLFGGYIIDRFGVRYSLFATYCICLVGNLLFSIGGSYKNYTLILVGRSIFGIGNETCSQSVIVLITKWFIDGKLNLAYALNGVALGFSGMAAGIISPLIVGSMKDPHLGRALWCGMYVNIVCTIFLLPTLYIDYKGDKQTEAIEEDKMKEIQALLHANEEASHQSDKVEIKLAPKGFRCKDLKQYKKVFWVNNLSGVI